MPNLYVALLHYPVMNKSGDMIASAITNLDIHDISRASRTYGVRAFYLVTPLTDQKELAEKIVSHWIDGTGARYNPIRGDALKLVQISDSIEEVKAHIRTQESTAPEIVVTCARHKDRSIGYETFRNMLKNGNPYLLCFGTAWGLSDDFINQADYVLEPIKGNTDYNHLSVRCAAGIILDRLLGGAM